MSVNLSLTVAAVVLLTSGAYLLMQRTLTRALLGVTLAGHAANVMLLVAGGPAGDAPVATGGATEGYSDPLPQALVLTALVITLGITAFLLAMAYRNWRLTAEDEVPDDPEDRRIAARTAAGVADRAADEADESETDTAPAASHEPAPTAPGDERGPAS
ncbi:Na(+)/H(+) antiporter subunit C [Allostreptomyces psammosilenae]|uniref:Multicomponent Na+:H+ antiporter subunit C n=1 Tax=Allostreptomyces psammosilenae TaxID=1892865 RepID=A0A852ZSS5_9ACTN|nr:Na(+)/H(+) antiporter subunit C [Allostreptomyces psammosilenae]NYI04310.1 multicomponent Na+:H+ antiporter subunit C [Allostreptomyces psammosilenae]